MISANVFIAFPPGSGGNHLRNILLSSTDLFVNTADNIHQVYDQDQITVHCNDIGSQTQRENLTRIKLQTALSLSNKNHLFYGHFAELVSFKDLISEFKNKKFICISVKSDGCKQLLNNRKQAIGTPKLDAYHLGEQTFLYENFVYEKIFKVDEHDVMDISITEFFSQDLSVPVQLLENFLEVSIDVDRVNYLHQKWLEKNCLLT